MLSDVVLSPIKVGDCMLEIDFGSPGAELQEVARKELRETPELQKESIERLKELLKGSVSQATKVQ